MLGLPRSTEVTYRITKEKIYANTSMTIQLRDMIKEQIESVIWRNKLSSNTIAVFEGEVVKEIQVLEVAVREKNLDKRILSAIAKAIPYNILFVLTYSGKAQAWINAAGTFYNTDWFPYESLILKFEGLNLDIIYDNLVRQVAGGRLSSEDDINEAVEKDKHRQRLEREIAALEKKVLNEKQFNRQVEQNSQLKQLKAEREALE